MYKIHSKAKLIVIDIINPITRKANIFNIASPPHSQYEIEVQEVTHTSAKLTFYDKYYIPFFIIKQANKLKNLFFIRTFIRTYEKCKKIISKESCQTP